METMMSFRSEEWQRIFSTQPVPLQSLARNDRGIALATALLFLMVLTLLGSTAVIVSSTDIKIGGNYKVCKQAFYAAEAGMERARCALKSATLSTVLVGSDGVSTTADDGILSFGASVGFGNGDYSVTVSDNSDGDGNAFSDADGKVVVTSTGTSSASEQTIEALLQKVVPSTSRIRAAVTANGPIAANGNCEIDGRDHDLDGNLANPNAGTLGISTVDTCSISGSTGVGGTVAGTDVPPPSSSAAPGTVEQGTAWSPPGTPDAVLGLPEGTLLAMAQSGTGGSQYVVYPSTPSMPLSGVTYVVVPSGNEWEPNILSGTGVLVVHNSSTNAELKNTNSGTFTGMVIADDYAHCHSNILGALFNLTSGPSASNCLGNGDGNIRYSSIAISTALNNLVSVRYISWREKY